VDFISDRSYELRRSIEALAYIVVISRRSSRYESIMLRHRQQRWYKTRAANSVGTRSCASCSTFMCQNLHLVVNTRLQTKPRLAFGPSVAWHSTNNNLSTWSCHDAGFRRERRSEEKIEAFSVSLVKHLRDFTPRGTAPVRPIRRRLPKSFRTPELEPFNVTS
jgi:hypothetical protein